MLCGGHGVDYNAHVTGCTSDGHVNVMLCRSSRYTRMCDVVACVADGVVVVGDYIVCCVCCINVIFVIHACIIVMSLWIAHHIMGMLFRNITHTKTHAITTTPTIPTTSATTTTTSPPSIQPQSTTL